MGTEDEDFRARFLHGWLPSAGWSSADPSSRLTFLCACHPPTYAQVSALGVSADRIVFANPCKRPKDLRCAVDRGVELTTFDTEAGEHTCWLLVTEFGGRGHSSA